MYFLGLGVLLIILKLLNITMVAQWSWWYISIPFCLAVMWWMYADASGYTKRKEMEKMEARKEDRIQKQRDALRRK